MQRGCKPSAYWITTACWRVRGGPCISVKGRTVKTVSCRDITSKMHGAVFVGPPCICKVCWLMVLSYFNCICRRGKVLYAHVIKINDLCSIVTWHRSIHCTDEVDHTFQQDDTLHTVRGYNFRLSVNQSIKLHWTRKLTSRHPCSSPV